MNYDKTEIGSNAGKIWNFLNINGPVNIQRIKDATDLSRTQILLAIGWLLREEKITTPETESRSILFKCLN